MVSQTERLYQLLRDGLPHRTDELVEKIYRIEEGPTIARLGARVNDIKKKYEVDIESWPDKNNRKLWFYKLHLKNPHLSMGENVGAPPTQGALFESTQFTDY